MVGISLEEFQRSQSVQIAKEIIGQSEEHEQKIQSSWQRSWEGAHNLLVSLLRSLDKDFDEACEKCNHPLEKFSDSDLFYLVNVRVRALEKGQIKIDKLEKSLEVNLQLEELGKKYEELERSFLALQETNKSLISENAGLNAHLAALKQAQIDNLNISHAETNSIPDNSSLLEKPGLLPGWLKAWQESKVFEKTSTAILIMGETGMALRPSITERMAKCLSLNKDNISLDEAIVRLLTQEDFHPIFIEVIKGASKQGSSSGGNRPDVLRLTEEGKLAYQLLTGKVPRENEYERLLRHHSTPEHTILNIQAAEMLDEAGLQIKGQAQEVRLLNGETLIPDITALDKKTGDIIFVEVERDVHKDPRARKQKWINLFEASNGNIYVFCDNLTCQRAIQGEINLALRGLTFNSFLTNLHGLRLGKRSEKDGGIWLSTRRMK